ncbi:NAD(P)-binding protein [Lipomyces tetrasporus]|uniref:NAD(P)-binding protein n=1 Tax=Lipomyces tetrasporus TaxID=54092 RepID=A0AAD7QML2_9ASCO|nr:NAD(P)-binding protein [Lipomyces tetrasporus]KAJ8098127.1 NAD(P)-binding protein [Lipomyces tetrasporus]
MVKSVLITGCSEGGIGDYLARDLHNRGLKVFTSARDLKNVEHLKTLGLNVLALDVTSSESVEAGVREVRSAAGGTLDILVNNSESAYSMPVLDTDLNIAKKMFNVNLFGVIRVTKAFSPLLTAAKGKIVNLGSIVGAFPASFMGTYNASKAAVNLISDNLRIEVAPFGVQVVTVT